MYFLILLFAQSKYSYYLCKCKQETNNKLIL